jgi:septum formation protein
MSRIWLASGSPRRKTLLEWAGFVVDVHSPNVDESLLPDEAPVAYALRLALAKANTAPNDVLALAADTVVHRDGELFDKPANRKQAIQTLMALSDQTHQVTTAVAIRMGVLLEHFSVTTQVRFRSLMIPEIEAYVATGEADDKAGAYGIQGRAAVFVAEVQGSWTNVVGLPIEACLPTLQSVDGTQA